MRDIESNSGVSVGSVERIIHEHLLFKKVCAWWVQKMLIFDLKAQCVVVPAKHLHWFELKGNKFLEQTVTCDETLVHCFTPESKQSSMAWHHKGSPTPKKFKTQLSADVIMGSVFWDSEEVTVEFLPYCVNN